MDLLTDVEKLKKYICEKLVLENVELGEEYFYASLPLCIIDAVFSIGVNYEQSTAPTVKRWCEWSGWQLYGHPAGNSHAIDDLVKLYEDKHRDFDFFATNVFVNRQRTSSKSGILKAEAVYLFAKTLSKFGIQTLDDTKNGILHDIEAEAAIRKIKGQASGISYKYFSMLAGSESLVKADRMICRFVAQALEKKEHEIKPDYAARLVISTANELRKKFPHLNPRLLDYAIWNYQRGVKSSALQGSPL